MDDLRPWRCFVAVAHELHFGRAAQTLVLPQSTVSQQVRRLETEIGGALFRRTTRSVRLTPLGETVLPHAEAALSAVDDTLALGRSAAHDGPTALRIGVAMDVDSGELTHALRRLRQDWPDATVSLRSMRTTDQLRAIDAGELDLGFVWEPPADGHLRRRVVGTTGLVAFVADDHRFAGGGEISLDELATEPLVAWTASLNPWTRRRLGRAFREHGLDPLIVDEADGYDAQMPLVLEGRGVGITAGSISDLKITPGIEHVPVSGDTRFERCLVWPREIHHPVLDALLERIPG